MRQLVPVIYLTGFTVLALLVQWRTGAFSADRGLTADEAAHFVTATMIYDFCNSNELLQPMRFALRYYQHFPRVAIGHWPPFFHAIQALFFRITGPSMFGALLFQSLIAGLAAGIPAAIAQRRWGLIAGVGTGFLVFLSPKFLFLLNAVMIDNLSGLMVLLTALAWSSFWQRRTWAAAWLFGGTAVCATLCKGNALGLGLLPLIHAILCRELGALRLAKTWCVAALIALVVLPWYLLTFKLTANGFNYSWGWEFSSFSFPLYSRYLVQMVGIPVFLGFVMMAIKIVRPTDQPRDDVMVALLAAVVAIFLFQVIAPADVQSRYLISALPALAPLGVGGVVIVGKLIAHSVRFRWTTESEPHSAGGATNQWLPIQGAMLSAGFTGCVVLLSITTVFSLPQTRNYHMMPIARALIASDSPNPLVLLCTSPNAEGAAIAAFDSLERRPWHYLVRGTQAISSSNFMGSNYRAKLTSPDQLRRYLAEHQIGWIVLETSSDSFTWTHNRVATELADQAETDWREVRSFSHSHGSIRLYALPDCHRIPANISDALSASYPEMLSGLENRVP